MALAGPVRAAGQLVVEVGIVEGAAAEVGILGWVAPVVVGGRAVEVRILEDEVFEQAVAHTELAADMAVVLPDNLLVRSDSYFLLVPHPVY